MAGDGRTRDDVEAELGIRLIPGGLRSWLDIVQDAAAEEGAILSDVCLPTGQRPPPAAARAKHKAWAVLARLGCYSLNEIAEPWGADHSTVIYALRKHGIVAKPRTCRAHAWSVGAEVVYEPVDPEHPVLADRGGRVIAVGDVVNGRCYGGVVRVSPDRLATARQEAA